ncbi:SDR family NAD(P)-dependent oxidoreductase [Sphingomonas sp. 22176]|uniref:SDR family NAD(P)-dependent oxidoreductase n=1 Tax=Sphingomonas sp. 22176 TaxID=3453884 RepID=UPI003F84C603
MAGSTFSSTNAGIVDPQDGPPRHRHPGSRASHLGDQLIGTLAVTQAMLPLLQAAPKGRIVNLSSALGSLAVMGDSSSPYYAARLIGYNASKAAVNMLTVQLAAELQDTGIVINSVAPGYVKTDLTGHSGFMTPEEGARRRGNGPLRRTGRGNALVTVGPPEGHPTDFRACSISRCAGFLRAGRWSCLQCRASTHRKVARQRRRAGKWNASADCPAASVRGG